MRLYNSTCLFRYCRLDFFNLSFDSKGYKARHQIECGKNSGQVMIPAISMNVDWNITNQDFRNMVNKMILDEVSAMAKSKSTILVIGSRIYSVGKEGSST